ncbi:DEAD/DEAH box helicase family protein [Streptomyces sp. NPDC020883]|uniref:DEAD/DEAH box helicase family protein n=1 Tax=Streptomyces sp. NPDC020883 TaxID=3365099 RepID=UPI003787F52D
MTPRPTPERKTLKKHQITTVENSVRELRQGGRGLIVAPCGTGKTLMAARIAEELARSSHARRRLILAHTRDLVAQTYRAFLADSEHLGHTLAVCGPLDIDDLPRTTSAAELTRALADHDHYTVFATYASLVDADGIQGAVIHGHRDYQLPPWDLIICDEAHFTSGSLGKAWAAVHDDARIPARRRLHLTATPRVWETDPRYAQTMTPGTGGPHLAASMDNEDIYGRRLMSMQLSQAISEKLARDYRIVLVAVDHPTLQPQLRRTRNASAGDDLALMSLATTVLKTCATYNLEKVVSFHRSVKDGAAFIDTLTATADALDGETLDTPHGTVPLRPKNLWARHIHMDSPDRFELLEHFRSGGTADEVRIMANAKLFTHGTDINTLDALLLAAPKTSVTDITQCVGRVLRLHPTKDDKATLIVPIYLTPDEDPADLLNAEAFQPLYNILLALRAHDLRIADRLPTTDNLDVDQIHPPLQAPGNEPGVPEEPAELSAPLEDTGTPPFSGPEGSQLPEIIGTDGVRITPREINRVLNLRVFQPQGVTNAWMDTALEAMRFWEEYGHLAPTPDQAAAFAASRTADRRQIDLYTWLPLQRAARRRGELQQFQISFLDAHGMAWEPREEARALLITYAEQCARDEGGLAVPKSYRAPDGYELGLHLNHQRAQEESGKINARLADELSRIDENWNPFWDFRWQVYYQIARHRHRQGQDLRQPGDGRAYRTWLRDPAASGLLTDQRLLLQEIGLDPLDPAATPA